MNIFTGKLKRDEHFYQLGVAHLRGSGVTKDYRLAIDAFIKASDCGYTKANWQLFYIYIDGEYTAKSLNQAESFLEKVKKDSEFSKDEIKKMENRLEKERAKEKTYSKEELEYQRKQKMKENGQWEATKLNRNGFID